jgi:hypothetical protein
VESFGRHVFRKRSVLGEPGPDISLLEPFLSGAAQQCGAQQDRDFAALVGGRIGEVGEDVLTEPFRVTSGGFV